MSILMMVVIVGVIILILGAVFMAKSVSMYKESEKDKKYDKMLNEPMKKFGDSKAEELAKKYETDKEGE